MKKKEVFYFCIATFALIALIGSISSSEQWLWQEQWECIEWTDNYTIESIFRIYQSCDLAYDNHNAIESCVNFSVTTNNFLVEKETLKCIKQIKVRILK